MVCDAIDGQCNHWRPVLGLDRIRKTRAMTSMKKNQHLSEVIPEVSTTRQEDLWPVELSIPQVIALTIPKLNLAGLWSIQIKHRIQQQDEVTQAPSIIALLKNLTFPSNKRVEGHGCPNQHVYISLSSKLSRENKIAQTKLPKTTQSTSQKQRNQTPHGLQDSMLKISPTHIARTASNLQKRHLLTWSKTKQASKYLKISMRHNIFSLHERIDQEECKHNNFFPHLISVCKFQRFPSVHQMPAISILDAMPSTIAVLATIDKGLDAMPSLITVVNNGIYLHCKWVSVHSGQRLCTGDLGSKSHDCFFHVFHSLTSKEPFPCPAAWKIFFLFDAWSPQMHGNNEVVVFPEHLVMGPKLHSGFKLLISIRTGFPTIVKQPLHCIDQVFLCKPILPFFYVCRIIRTEIFDTLGSHVAPNPTSSPMGTPFLQIQLINLDPISITKNSLIDGLPVPCVFFFLLPGQHPRTKSRESWEGSLSKHFVGTVDSFGLRPRLQPTIPEQHSSHTPHRFHAW